MKRVLLFLLAAVLFTSCGLWDKEKNCYIHKVDGYGEVGNQRFHGEYISDYEFSSVDEIYSLGFDYEDEDGYWKTTRSGGYNDYSEEYCKGGDLDGCTKYFTLYFEYTLPDYDVK